MRRIKNIIKDSYPYWLNENRNRRDMIAHRGKTEVEHLFVERHASEEDVDICIRIARAYRAAIADSHALPRDHWSALSPCHEELHGLMDYPRKLAEYLANMHRHRITEGITQGDVQYRVLKNRSWARNFECLRIKDSLVCLAEAVGVLPVENPEQGTYGENINADPYSLVAGINKRIGIDITPPDVDGGMLKVPMAGGLYCF
jgi:hypothetical protein